MNKNRVEGFFEWNILKQNLMSLHDKGSKILRGVLPDIDKENE